MRVRYAFVALVVLTLAMTGVAILFTVTYYHAEQASQQRQAAAEQASQQKQGEMLEQKLCTGFGQLAALKPPGGSPADNPSRAYLQDQHDVLVGLGTDVGCAVKP